MRVVLALGGNAILRRGESPSAEIQRENLAKAAELVAQIARQHEVVLTHGNGPQIGLLALQSASYREVPAYPLDILGAQTEGMLGYMLEQELLRHLHFQDVATLVTQVIVSATDPALSDPTKPIGAVLTPEEAERAQEVHGWTVGPDGSHIRRLVPSPRPMRIVPARTIRRLVEAGTIVISGGGGGIPVVRTADGGFRGLEAVIDKDMTAGLLAREVRAHALLLLTDVDGVQIGFGTPDARTLGEVRPEELEAHEFPEGSMGPKVKAALEFVRGGGRMAAIGALEEAPAILEGRAGTRIVPE
jgi:carbamate kinase